jgi:hypothetical protein
MTAAQVASVVAPQTSDADPNRHRAKRTSTGLPLLELVMSGGTRSRSALR